MTLSFKNHRFGLAVDSEDPVDIFISIKVGSRENPGIVNPAEDTGKR
ncbi:hypothetical protein [Paenibacillus glacialis]|nr:hypothetical protein [Paenibacillus glacialis]